MRLQAIAIELTPQQNEQEEQAKVETPQPPQDTTPDVTLPEEKPPEKVQPTNPSELNTARVEAAAPHIDASWTFACSSSSAVQELSERGAGAQ